MTMTQDFLHSVDNTSADIQNVSERNLQTMQTNILILEANQTAPNIVQVTLSNTGQTKLATFNEWDIIVNYDDSQGNNHVVWLPYTTSLLGDNLWNLQGVYLNAAQQTPAIFDPGILDPGEQMIINCQLNPSVGPNTVIQITISTPNGISVSKSFQGYQSISPTPLKLSSIAVTPASPADLAVGSTQQFTATGTYSDGSVADITSQVTWASSDPAIASISPTGLATGVTAGNTNITASASGVISPTTPLTVSSGS